MSRRARTPSGAPGIGGGPGAPGRRRGRRPSPRRPTSGSSCAAWPWTRPSGGSRSRRCSSGYGAATRSTEGEADLLGACLVASIDHGPLSPSALVTRTIASTRADPDERSGGRDPGVRRASWRRRQPGDADPRDVRAGRGDLDAWADERLRGGARGGPSSAGHRPSLAPARSARRAAPRGRRGAVRWPARPLPSEPWPRGSAATSGKPVPVNIDGALAVALTALRLDPAYGDFLFAIARSFGLAAHFVEEQARERPMRMIDPTAAHYDGAPVPGYQIRGGGSHEGPVDLAIP